MVIPTNLEWMDRSLWYLLSSKTFLLLLQNNRIKQSKTWNCFKQIDGFFKYFVRVSIYLVVAVLAFIDFIKSLKKNWRGFQKVFFFFDWFQKKLLEILKTILALEAGCVNQKSYLEILEYIKRSDILCSYLARKRHWASKQLPLDWNI